MFYSMWALKQQIHQILCVCLYTYFLETSSLIAKILCIVFQVFFNLGNDENFIKICSVVLNMCTIRSFFAYFLKMNEVRVQHLGILKNELLS